MQVNQLIKKPSAWLPIAMPLIVLTILLVSFAVSGIPSREPDEGTAAHLFQIWLVLEIFAAAFFAIKWLPQNPKPALFILAIQILAALATCAPVFILNL